MNHLTPSEFRVPQDASRGARGVLGSRKTSPPPIVYAHLSIGRARGWSIAQTLQNIHVMRGNKISEHATVQWADVMASGPSRTWRRREWSPNRVACRVQRRGLAPMTLSGRWRRRRANLNNSQTWKQYPERMPPRASIPRSRACSPTSSPRLSGANTYSTEEAGALLRLSREDESKLSDVVGVLELAPTEESLGSSGSVPCPAPAPAPDPITNKLVERVRREAREEGVEPSSSSASSLTSMSGPTCSR